SVMHVPRLIAPGLTFGAALSNSTHDRPCASLPVTTRRIGFGSLDNIAVLSFAPHRNAKRVCLALSSGLRDLSWAQRAAAIRETTREETSRGCRPRQRGDDAGLGANRCCAGAELS